jgi:Fic family protein
MYKPNYSITNTLLNTIAEIESYRVKADSSYILPEREVEMRYRATVEATHNSTHIEGNPLTIKQVDSVLRGGNLTRHLYAELEVKNYKKALDYIDKRKLTGAPVAADDILYLHRLTMSGLLPDEKTGAFRKGDVYIVDQNDNVKYTAPKAKVVAAKLAALLAWMKDSAGDVNPVLAAAVLHYQFVALHPFADGNGRTARLAVMLYLGIRDYDFRASIVLDSYYAYERDEYYAALQSCHGMKYSEACDITPWVEYFADGFLSSAKVLWAEISLLTAAVRPLMEKRRIRSEDSDILSYAKRFGSVSISEAANILPGVSRRSLQRIMKKLADDGLLIVKGSGKATRYHWRE